MRKIKSLFGATKQFVNDNPVAVGAGVVAVGLAAYGISGIEAVEALSAADTQTYGELMQKVVDFGKDSLSSAELLEFERIHELILEQGSALSKVLVPAIWSGVFGAIAGAAYAEKNC